MGSLSQPRLNIFTVGNMRVMICLGQGGLRYLSASSFNLFFALQVYLYSCHIHVSCSSDISSALCVDIDLISSVELAQIIDINEGIPA